MIAGALERNPRLLESEQGFTKRCAIRISDGDVIKARRATRRWLSAAALPRIEPDVMVVATGAEKGGARAHALGYVESQHPLVESQRSIEIRNLQVHVANIDAGVDGFVHVPGDNCGFRLYFMRSGHGTRDKDLIYSTLVVFLQ
jgi:hypothetical protein